MSVYVSCVGCKNMSVCDECRVHECECVWCMSVCGECVNADVWGVVNGCVCVCAEGDIKRLYSSPFYSL